MCVFIFVCVFWVDLKKEKGMQSSNWTSDGNGFL